jgi:hypothetical protein
MSQPPARDERRRERLRAERGYGLVLLLVGASIVFQMVATRTNVAAFVSILLQAGTLVLVVWIAGGHRPVVRLAAAVAVLAALATVVIWVVKGEIPEGPAAVTNGLLVAFAPAVIAVGLVRRLRRDRTVTPQTLSGVLAIYLLLGMLFSFLYGMIGAFGPGDLFAGRATETVSDELYFSFVTLSTVGYGDFTPAGDVARTVAITEMLTGQIYLVTIVSLIVANLGRRAASGPPDPD